jgi:hypothetical protein
MNPASQIPVTTAAIVAVIVVVKFKKLINRFRDSGTTSSQAAKTLEELKIHPRRLFRRLLNRGVISEAGSGRFYLHEGNLDEYNQMRRIRVMIVFGILIILFLIELFILKY